MADFAMCPACQAEYDDPGNRRFHAQPTCCPVCGPQLRLVDRTRATIATDDPLGTFAAAIRAGQIGALKGLGGYHLACDARSGAALAELRRRKHRDEKPFAVLSLNEAAAAAALSCRCGRTATAAVRAPPDCATAQTVSLRGGGGSSAPAIPVWASCCRITRRSITCWYAVENRAPGDDKRQQLR